ncbi:glycosyltransferase [Maribacter polysaccharolyticus]|uniref:glycosyltransferase n=1 Tax=Maribacter polysaccharolyticus TaxID=3020831 RepID=UPI00237FB13E|nr:glycosyltransferase [Maribacter polysaccharolyticus]MDE3741485.1 glycosyltransferase [Maribacter polysaccharolyticus]
MANILFIIGLYPNYGGTEKVTTVLANAFVDRGHKVTIASFEQPHPELKDEELNASIQLVALGFPLRKNSNLRLLKNVIDSKNIDVIINQWCLPYKVTSLINKARKKRKCILISALHGVPDQNKRLLTILHYKDNTKNPIKRFFYGQAHKAMVFVTGLNLNYVYKHTDQYVVLSKSFIKTFKALSKIKESAKIRAIANPVTIEAPQSFDYLNEKGKENSILYVGRMDHANKRVHRVVEAWEEVHLKYQDWKLILVGDGPEKKTLESYVKTKNIERVVFEGFKKEAPIAFYQRASILLLTSDLEGFGLVVIEGMIYGVVPIVYGSYSAIYDIIENGKSGFITPTPYKKTNTVQQIEKLITDKVLRQKMSGAAYDRAQYFALDTILDEWESLFDFLNN